MDIVEENIESVSEWLRIGVEEQLRYDLPQAHKIAEYYKDDFETAKQIVREAYQQEPPKCPKCPEYMYDAFKDSEDCEEVKHELEIQISKHLKRFKKDVVYR